MDVRNSYLTGGVCVMVYTQSGLIDKIADMFGSEESLGILGETFIQEIKIIEGRPIFPTYEQIEYLNFVGVKTSRDSRNNYRIYIGDDISDIEDKLNGVELPSRVLNSDSDFKEQVLIRIRRAVGSPFDN